MRMNRDRRAFAIKVASISVGARGIDPFDDPPLDPLSPVNGAFGAVFGLPFFILFPLIRSCDVKKSCVFDPIN
jgi:hypothetical protein